MIIPSCFVDSLIFLVNFPVFESGEKKKKKIAKNFARCTRRVETLNAKKRGSREAVERQVLAHVKFILLIHQRGRRSLGESSAYSTVPGY